LKLQREHDVRICLFQGILLEGFLHLDTTVATLVFDYRLKTWCDLLDSEEISLIVIKLIITKFTTHYMYCAFCWQSLTNYT